MALLNILILAGVIAILVKLSVMAVGLPSWAYYVVLPVIGVVLYATNVVMLRRYIEKNAPDYAASEEVSEGVQKWELTAGSGVVPKWVSWIGLAAIGTLLALVFPVFAGLFR